MEDLLLFIIFVIPLIAQIWELILMWNKRESVLLALSILFIVSGLIFPLSSLILLIIKFIFYSRHWSDKSIRKVLYLQLIPVVVFLAMVLRFFFFISI